MPEKKLSMNQVIIAAFILGLTYGILFALQAARAIVAEWPIIGPYLSIPAFESPMFFAMPFFAFFAVFFLVDWVNKSSKRKIALTPIFPVVFFILALAAYHVALYWYIANFAALQGTELILGEIDFAGRLAGSAYMPFIWGGVFGWIARFAVEKLKI
jgi:quinol-cytochrome oxidoreductase complex cytochrome b subunit